MKFTFVFFLLSSICINRGQATSILNSIIPSSYNSFSHEVRVRTFEDYTQVDSDGTKRIETLGTQIETDQIVTVALNLKVIHSHEPLPVYTTNGDRNVLFVGHKPLGIHHQLVLLHLHSKDAVSSWSTISPWDESDGGDGPITSPAITSYSSAKYTFTAYFRDSVKITVDNRAGYIFSDEIKEFFIGMALLKNHKLIGLGLSQEHNYGQKTVTKFVKVTKQIVESQH